MNSRLQRHKTRLRGLVSRRRPTWCFSRCSF